MLDNILKTIDGDIAPRKHFLHNEQSVRVAEKLEKNGKGLNLSWEVLDGILHHPQKDPQLPATLEGQIVRYSDHIAYIRHDIEDAVLAGVIKLSDLPAKHTSVLGKNILDTIIPNIIEKSMGKDRIQMDKKVEDAMNGLYDFLYEKVYTSPLAKGEESKIPYLLTQLFKYYQNNPEKIPYYKKSWTQVEIVENIIDFIAGMTDRYAINKFSEIFIPNEWHPKTNMIPSATIDEIRNKTDILQVVGEYVALKKRGKNYLGLCPFHSEKTPSFTVSEDKQIFHCFGCGEGGNVFSFIMKAENVSFAEAVEMLGERSGIRVVNSAAKGSAPVEKEKYFSIMDMAQEYFVKTMEGTEGTPAKDYISKRGLNEETVKAFGLGYSLTAWDGLMNHLYRKGVSQADMLKLGLIIERSDKSGYYDRFRGRLMFPVYNLRGKVLGYSGRILTGDDEAKYVNSPDSPIYNKGYSLFGISMTKDDVKKSKTAVLVEGNVDLLSCWQYGIKNVAAPLGTALTENQAKTIRRFAENVVLAFDADNAGAAATSRSIEILKEAGLNVKVAAYKGGKDPDEALKKLGAQEFEKSIRDAMPWTEFKLLSAISKHDLASIEGRAKAAKEAAFVIGQEKDEFVRQGYIKLAAEKLGFSADDIGAEVKRQGFYLQPSAAPSQRRQVEKPSPKLEKAEECLIKLAVENADILNLMRASIDWKEFTGSHTKLIADVILTSATGGEDMSNFLLTNLPDEETKKILSRILVSDHPASDPAAMAKDCINTIKAHHIKAKMEDLKREIAEAEKSGKSDAVSDLHREFKDANEAYRSLSIQ